MADIFDRASELEAKQNASFLAAALIKSRPQQVMNADGTWPHPECVDCEIEIPAGRLKLGRIRCVHCQEDQESNARFRR